MKRKTNTKFYTFCQNNSGGFFKGSDDSGISEYVIIEAINAQQANKKAEEIGIYFDGCSEGNDCPCCGDRWYPVSESDGYKTPLIYGKSVYETEKDIYMESCFIHFINGEKKKIEFKNEKA